MHVRLFLLSGHIVRKRGALSANAVALTSDHWMSVSNQLSQSNCTPQTPIGLPLTLLRFNGSTYRRMTLCRNVSSISLKMQSNQTLQGKSQQLAQTVHGI